MLPAPQTPRPLCSLSRISGPVLLAVGVLFGVASVFLLALTARLYNGQQDLRAHAEHASGTIVDLKSRWFISGKSHQRFCYYVPVFTFTDYAGTPRRVTSRTGQGSAADYWIGQTVPVVYHHDHPGEAELDTFLARWSPVLIGGGLGAAFFLTGTFLVSLGGCRLLWPHLFPGQSGTIDVGFPPRDPAILSGR